LVRERLLRGLPRGEALRGFSLQPSEFLAASKCSADGLPHRVEKCQHQEPDSFPVPTPPTHGKLLAM
jgi:hypothetical protein